MRNKAFKDKVVPCPSGIHKYSGAVVGVGLQKGGTTFLRSFWSKALREVGFSLRAHIAIRQRELHR